MENDVAYTEIAWSTFAILLNMHWPPSPSDFNTGTVSRAIQASWQHPANMDATRRLGLGGLFQIILGIIGSGKNPQGTRLLARTTRELT